MSRIPANPASSEDRTVFVPPYDPRAVRLVRRINIALAIATGIALVGGWIFLRAALFGGNPDPSAAQLIYDLSFIPALGLLFPALAKGISSILGLSLTRVYEETADAIEAWMPHSHLQAVAEDGGLFEGFWKIWRGPRSAIAIFSLKEDPRDYRLELARSLAVAAPGKQIIFTPTLGATELSSQNPEEGYRLTDGPTYP